MKTYLRFAFLNAMSLVALGLSPLALPSCTYPGSFPSAEYLSPKEIVLDRQNGRPATAGERHAETIPVSTKHKRLPDPRYRPPVGLWELDRVASMVAKATGYEIRGRLMLNDDPDGPLARVRGRAGQGEIQINPRAVQRIPPNSWAFIIGHEFAHQLEHIGQHGSTTPERELQADIKGAEYAQAAGFDLAAHFGWMFSQPPHGSHSHGDWHARAEATARHFGIPPREIGWQVERYQRAGL
jgi:hypothetical protein